MFELAITQPKLDMPEVLWKAYIDFEIEQEEFNNTRNLYRRLLRRTQHVKVQLHIGLDKNFDQKIVNIFLPISFNISFGYSKEPSH